jgi:hypothetical protein
MRRLLGGTFAAAVLISLPLRCALAIGDFGPDTCMDGFVWREACGPSDHVCVLPQVRQQAHSDNSLASSRRQPGGGPFGPDTCKQGFVWREACGPGDHVCVTPDVRSQAAADNRAAGQRLKHPFCQRLAQTIVAQQQVNFQNRCLLTGVTWQNSSDANFRLCMNGSSVDMERIVDGQSGMLQTCLFCKTAPPDDPRCVQFPH